jgi:hypothetical protein
MIIVLWAEDDADRQEFWYEYHWWLIYHNPHTLRQAG